MRRRRQGLPWICRLLTTPKLLEMYAQQFEEGYEKGYTEVECAAKEIHDSPMVDIPKHSCVGEARARQEPKGKGTSSAELEVVVVLDPLVDADVQPVPPS